MTHPEAERPIHWEGNPDGICARRDDRSDEVTFTQENGTSITSTSRADWCGNVTCPICRATPEFAEGKARQDAYWAAEDAEAAEFFASEEGQAYLASMEDDPR